MAHWIFADWLSRIKTPSNKIERFTRTTQQLSITLPNEMAEAVKAKVLAGEYATESEVIRDGLRALMAQDRAIRLATRPGRSGLRRIEG